MKLHKNYKKLHKIRTLNTYCRKIKKLVECDNINVKDDNSHFTNFLFFAGAEEGT